jgi:putative endonuclease
MSEDVNRKLKEHNSGKTKSTKGFAPWEIVFIEEYQTRVEARKREKWLKSGIGKEFIKAYWSRSSVG